MKKRNYSGKRTEMISVRLTEDERRNLISLAKSYRMDKSDVIRLLINSYAVMLGGEKSANF